MFTAVVDEAGLPPDEHLWTGPPTFDPPPSMADTAPSAMFALELDYATTDPTRLSDADLVDAVVGFERMAAWAAARQYALLAEFHRRGGDGSVRPVTRAAPAREWAADEVALALTVSPGSAVRRLGEAGRLDGPLRATRDLLAAGRIDTARARLISDRTAVLDPAAAAAVEQRVLPDAPTRTWAQLDAALRRAVLAVDAEGAAARHRKAKAARRVEVFPGEDGMATLWAKLAAPDATAAFGWITRLARGMDTTGDPAGDPRGIDARRADVLVALLTGNLTIADGSTHRTRGATDSSGTSSTSSSGSSGSGSGTGRGGTGSGGTGSGGTGSGGTGSGRTDCATGGVAEPAGPTAARSDDTSAGTDSTARGAEDPTGERPGRVHARPVGADRPLIHLTIPHTTLTGADDEPCELAGYGPIPAHLARDLAARAGALWRRIVTDPLTGTVLDVGRTTYRPPAALADHVRTRDVACRNPRCRRPATTCELDHVTEWRDGGVTAEHNLCALCVRHHDLKEAPGWRVVLHDDRSLEWITPTGHRYRSRPHDHRAAPPPPPPASPPPPPPASASASASAGRPGEPEGEPPF